MNGQKTRSQSTAMEQNRRRWLLNRALLVLSLGAILLGIALGHAFITWLNATLI